MIKLTPEKKATILTLTTALLFAIGYIVYKNVSKDEIEAILIALNPLWELLLGFEILVLVWGVFFALCLDYD